MPYQNKTLINHIFPILQVHVMRDHYFHDAKMLAGMWSAKLGSTSWNVESDRKSRAQWEMAFKKVFEDPLAYWKHKFVKDADQQILAR